MAGQHSDSRMRRRFSRSRSHETVGIDDATIRREAEQVLVGELQDSATTAELLQDVSDELDADETALPGSRFRITRARAASAGGIVLVTLAAIARRSRRRR